MALGVAPNADGLDSRALERSRRNQCRAFLKRTFGLRWITSNDKAPADASMADHGVQVGLEFIEGGDSPCREMGHRLGAELLHSLCRGDSGGRLNSPLIGMGQPGFTYFEPAFVDELALMKRWAFEHMQADDAGSVYLRLTTRAIEQIERDGDGWKSSCEAVGQRYGHQGAGAGVDCIGGGEATAVAVELA